MKPGCTCEPVTGGEPDDILVETCDECLEQERLAKLDEYICTDCGCMMIEYTEGEPYCTACHADDYPEDR